VDIFIMPIDPLPTRWVSFPYLVETLGESAKNPTMLVHELLSQLHAGKVVYDFDSAELLSLWDLLPKEEIVDNVQKPVARLLGDIYFQGGPLAMRLLPGTEKSPVVSLEILTVADMRLRFAPQPSTALAVRPNKNLSEEPVTYKRDEIIQSKEVLSRTHYSGLIHSLVSSMQKYHELDRFWGVVMFFQTGGTLTEPFNPQDQGISLFERVFLTLKGITPDQFQVFPIDHNGKSYLGISHPDLNPKDVDMTKVLQPRRSSPPGPQGAAALYALGSVNYFWEHPYWAAFLVIGSILSWYHQQQPAYVRSYLRAA
jgi:hypothetical protein